MPPLPAATPRSHRRTPSPGTRTRVALSLAALILLPLSTASTANAAGPTPNPFRTQACEAESMSPNPTGPARAAAAPPPTLEALRNNPPYRSESAEADAARLAAVKQSAKSLGLRAGFARGIWCHQRDLERLAAKLDQLYDFNRLLEPIGGGLFLEPPIVMEHGFEVTFSEDNRKAATSSGRTVLLPSERPVTRPRHWTEYLVVDVEPLAPEHPKNRPEAKDRDQWDAWVKDGWQSGLQQAADTMDLLFAELDRDYLGMLTYRRLINEGRAVAPRATATNRGVTGNANEVRVNNTEIEIKRPSGLVTNPAKWRALPFAASPPTPSAPPTPGYGAAPAPAPSSSAPTRLKP